MLDCWEPRQELSSEVLLTVSDGQDTCRRKAVAINSNVRVESGTGGQLWYRIRTSFLQLVPATFACPTNTQLVPDTSTCVRHIHSIAYPLRKNRSATFSNALNKSASLPFIRWRIQGRPLVFTTFHEIVLHFPIVGALRKPSANQCSLSRMQSKLTAILP
ncbi:hypothetical protein E6O75_ATG00641 [Venturia nashicola]|uniref:Uncharacterized protein n=1 Tax=Venturia nashicola TaxID=86259 RepID=A0A4Z1PPC6_9PEZI|nr:hypothetical protein E6O75_ATG00641 [Venturia nashicola]